MVVIMWNVIIVFLLLITCWWRDSWEKEHNDDGCYNCCKLAVTGEVLRTSVIIGEIVHLEIETTARVLYLEDCPEELIVRGFDSEGKFD